MGCQQDPICHGVRRREDGDGQPIHEALRNLACRMRINMG